MNMKNCIFYFTGTGNSLKIAKDLADILISLLKTMHLIFKVMQVIFFQNL